MLSLLLFGSSSSGDAVGHPSRRIVSIVRITTIDGFIGDSVVMWFRMMMMVVLGSWGYLLIRSIILIP